MKLEALELLQIQLNDLVAAEFQQELAYISIGIGSRCMFIYT